MLKIIQNLSAYNCSSKSLSNNYSNNVNVKKMQLTDTFQKSNINFGRKLPSGDYSTSDIIFVKSKMNEKDDKWQKKLYKKKFNENRFRILLDDGAENGVTQRIGLGIATFGLSECVYQIRDIADRKYAHECVNGMAILCADLRNRKLKEEVAEIKKEEQQSQNKVNYLKEIHDVKENQLKPKLLDLIQREREGRPTDMPNCIMLSNKNDKINENLIKWAGENVNGRFIEVNHDDNLVGVLENAEENYQNTGDWNLIHVKNMDKLIDHNQVKDRVVEGMKDIMSAASEDYHSTFIFSSTHPEDLDSIALQPHRVKKINTEGIKTPEDSLIDDAKERLEDPQTPIETPISAINDLLTVANADKSLKLNWNHGNKEEKQVDNVIKTTFTSDEDKHYLDVYKSAKEHLA